jgi:hypothetical protein
MFMLEEELFTNEIFAVGLVPIISMLAIEVCVTTGGYVPV